MTADGPEKTRLFRATSTSDIICASIVADLLPRGRNILALSTDKSNAEPSEYRECYQSLARLHPWASVVDLSGIPMVSQFQKKLTLWNRYRGIGLAIASSPGAAQPAGRSAFDPRTVARAKDPARPRD